MHAVAQSPHYEPTRGAARGARHLVARGHAGPMADPRTSPLSRTGAAARRRMTARANLVVAATALAICLGGSLVVRVPLARAHSGGETLHSGKQGPTCAACHSGGIAPAVRFIGPANLGVAETATYRFEVQSMASMQRAAGFNVAASDGMLDVLPGQGEQLVAPSGELTHTMPKANADMTAGWDFTWTAPAVPGMYRLFGAGNSVNLNGQSTGDRSSSTTVDILVIASPTFTPTATPQPAVTETPGPIRTPTGARPGSPIVCVGDCDGDGTVAVNELIIGVNIALGNLSVSACPAFDVNGNDTVEINVLIAAVNNALNGCG